MKSVFNFSDYKAFLRSQEAGRKEVESGFRSKLAKTIGCQSGYITQVLNSGAHFSLEQGLRASTFLGLQQREQKYFLLLIEVARAGTTELVAFFKKDLAILREEQLNIKERVGDSRILSETEQTTYYSSWYYLAVHVLASLPEYNDAKLIADALKLPESAVDSVLVFLVQTGILVTEKGKLKSGITQVHLNRESPLIRQHHTNWRMAAVQSLMTNTATDVHYSTVSSLSREDAEKLRAEMVKLIESYVETVKPSPEEVVFGFNLDFYSLIKR